MSSHNPAFQPCAPTLKNRKAATRNENDLSYLGVEKMFVSGHLTDSRKLPAKKKFGSEKLLCVRKRSQMLSNSPITGSVKLIATLKNH